MDPNLVFYFYSPLWKRTKIKIKSKINCLIHNCNTQFIQKVLSSLTKQSAFKSISISSSQDTKLLCTVGKQKCSLFIYQIQSVFPEWIRIAHFIKYSVQKYCAFVQLVVSMALNGTGMIKTDLVSRNVSTLSTRGNSQFSLMDWNTEPDQKKNLGFKKLTYARLILSNRLKRGKINC